LSAPAEVSMGDKWFEIATFNHFWIQRRFQVLRRLAGELISGAREIAEIGCGHGLLQLQIERAYSREVMGFDLNEFALRRNLSHFSSVCCYDIHQENPEFKRRFDLIFLFDVLEHIGNEDQFLKSLLFHLAPEGNVVVNVPAGPWLISAYDIAAGHKRRYSIYSLRKATERNQLEVMDWSYWGFPLVPALMLRKIRFLRNDDENNIISVGFDPKSKTINQILKLASRCELIPQKFLGTSLMAVFRPQS
jgi:hypothetical protein